LQQNDDPHGTPCPVLQSACCCFVDDGIVVAAADAGIDDYFGDGVVVFAAQVPGEGEHKIMAYIRDERSAGRLPPNTR